MVYGKRCGWSSRLVVAVMCFTSGVTAARAMFSGEGRAAAADTQPMRREALFRSKMLDVVHGGLMERIAKEAKKRMHIALSPQQIQALTEEWTIRLTLGPQWVEDDAKAVRQEVDALLTGLSNSLRDALPVKPANEIDEHNVEGGTFFVLYAVLKPLFRVFKTSSISAEPLNVLEKLRPASKYLLKREERYLLGDPNAPKKITGVVRRSRVWYEGEPPLA